MTPRDLLRLEGVHPILAIAVQAIADRMTRNGTPMFVIEGVRTAERQNDLYQEGRTTPGPGATAKKPLGNIVTTKDGIKLKSPHQVHPDALGYAVDMAFVGGDPFSLAHPWDLYGQTAECLGLTWGGRWKNPVDRPHVELPIIIITPLKAGKIDV